MRENRPYGSEGGEGYQPSPTPIILSHSLQRVDEALDLRFP